MTQFHLFQLKSGLYRLIFLSGLLASGLGFVRTPHALAATPQASSKKASLVLGKIVELKGKVWLSQKAPSANSTKKTTDEASIASDTAEVRAPAQVGVSIFIGDILSTEGDGQVKVLLGDKDAALLIKRNSRIKFLSPEAKSYLLNLDQGMILSSVKPQRDIHRNHFQIQTHAATLGVRGTTLFVKAEPNRDVLLCTCSGIVAVDGKAIILGKNHDSPKLIQPGTEPISKRLKKGEKGSDHSDSEGAELAKLMGSS